LPRAESSGSTPKSVASVPKESEEVIDQLRPRVIGKTVSLRGFNHDPKDLQASQTSQLLKASVKNFLSNWYGLKVVSEKEKTDIIIFNEPSTTDTANLVRLRRSNRRGPVVIALCSHTSRFDRAYANTELNADVGFLAKPIGPLKLARAISQCLDGISVTTTPGVEKASSAGSGSTTGTTDLSNIFEDLSLSPSGGQILDNSRMAADSDNARKAIESPTPTPGIEKTQEFPFPSESDRPPAATARSMPADNVSLKSIGSGSDASASGILTKMENTATTAPAGLKPVSRAPSFLPAPRLLLVDDNKINLRLLRMYMRRRNYPIVDEAENGLEAVDAMQNREEGYDIIFMDISMPILDGFGATRQIRQIERARKDKAGREGAPAPLPALVIALTGLASSRDQSEAFTSGVDLFLTKPVAFKEVGKMLDNWEANREREARPSDEVPGGSSTQERETMPIDEARGSTSANIGESDA
jgi:CheY-like chemotaxis protein